MQVHSEQRFWHFTTELLEAQRIQAEGFGGRMSAGEVLQPRRMTFASIGCGSFGG